MKSRINDTMPSSNTCSAASDAASDWYTRQLPSCTKREWGSFPPLLSPHNVMVLFTKVTAPPPGSKPQSAIWHFTDVRKSLATFQRRTDVELLPLYTTDQGGSVLISSWPDIGGALGLTQSQIAEAQSKEARPAGGGGFAYMVGPDNALVEYSGIPAIVRRNDSTMHLWQDQPLCALLWYQTHLNPPTRGLRGTAADRGGPARRAAWPRLAGAEARGNVPYAALSVRPRGQLQNHFGLVADLDAWIAKLRGVGVTLLAEPCRLDGTRAAAAEGRSRKAIELVEGV